MRDRKTELYWLSVAFRLRIMPTKRLPFSGKTPQSLIQRLPEDRPDDWNTFCGIYAPLIYKLAQQYGLQDADADEVTADVVKGLMQRLRRGLRIDSERGWFRNYVSTTTRNVVAVHYRRQIRVRSVKAGGGSKHLVREPTSQTPPEELIALEQRARVRFCLDQLRRSPRTRRRNFLVFEQYVIDGEPPEKVAKRHGLTTQRVFEIKYEMLKRLDLMLRRLDKDLGEV